MIGIDRVGRRSVPLLRVAATAVLLAAAPVAGDEVRRLSAPVVKDEVSETFGAPLDLTLPRMGLSALVEQADAYLGKAVLVDAQVAKVCQKKGCFFVAQEGGATLRVSFRDYGFFVPTDSGGKQVTLAGQLVQRELTPAEARHFAADAMTGEGTFPAGTVYEIVADAVRIPR